MFGIPSGAILRLLDMNELPSNQTPPQAASLIALRKQLHNLEGTIASLLQLALAQPEGELREQLIDRVSKLDSIRDLMLQALDAMLINADDTATGP